MRDSTDSKQMLNKTQKQSSLCKVVEGELINVKNLNETLTFHRTLTQKRLFEC